MPTRYLKPGICDSEAIDNCSPLAEILFYRLLVNVDDFGRLDARPAVIRSRCFPLKDTISNLDTENLLFELQDCGLIVLYEHENAKFLQMQKWDNVPRAKESKFPAFDDSCTRLHANVCKREETANRSVSNENNLKTSEFSHSTGVINIISDDPTVFAEKSIENQHPDINCTHLHTNVCIENTNLPVTGTVTVTETDIPEPKTETVTDKPEPGSGGGSKKTSPRSEKKLSPVKNQEAPLTRETWEAYSNAYESRYGAKPVRNATVAGQLAQFVKRIGRDESPRVAEFFVHHNNQFYVTKMHTVGLLLADAEKLRTEWATKRTITQTQARQMDKTQARGNVFNNLIDEAKASAS